MKLTPEESLRVACVDYCKLFGDVICVGSLNDVSWGQADPTKLWTKKAYKDKLTKLGALWGDPDLDVLANRTRFKAELKIRPNKPQEHQKACMNRWIKAGVPCYAVYDFEAFKALVDAARAGRLPVAELFDVDLGDNLPW